jgi:hypothetical protein
VQGLELDWVCMTWDADLRFAQSDWSYNAFRGSRWTLIMVFFVPPGDSLDATRAPDYYDSTFAYLSGLGMGVVWARSDRTLPSRPEGYASMWSGRLAIGASDDNCKLIGPLSDREQPRPMGAKRSPSCPHRGRV